MRQRMPGILFSPSTISCAPCAELFDHRLDGVLRSVERFDRGDLLEARRAADAVDDELAERVDQLRRQDREAEAPAGHRPCLREAVEDDRALLHVGSVAIETCSPSKMPRP